MPKVTEAYRAARRDEIIGVATSCFAAKGYRGTSMADIIRESGLSAGAIYGHFTGKKELLAAVAQRVVSVREDELAARAVDHDGPLSPGEIMATLIDGIRREKFSGVIVQLWAEAAVDPDIGRIIEEVLDRLRATVSAQIAAWAAAVPGRVDGDPVEWAHRMAPVVIGAGPGFMIQRAIVSDFDEDAYLAALPEAFPH